MLERFVRLCEIPSPTGSERALADAVLGELGDPALGIEVSDMGGTMRLGADPVKLHEGTKAREIFGEAVIYKRHRHRYEVNNQLRRRIEDEGMVCGGTSPDERLVEMVELPDHPFFVASQYHPEFNSRPNRPEPLFREFVGAAAHHAGEKPADGGELDSVEDAETGDVGARRSA